MEKRKKKKIKRVKKSIALVHNLQRLEIRSAIGEFTFWATVPDDLGIKFGSKAQSSTMKSFMTMTCSIERGKNHKHGVEINYSF